MTKPALRRIEDERRKQLHAGYDSFHDDKYTDRKLLVIASQVLQYMRYGKTYDDWDIVKKHIGDSQQMLVIVAALLAAEIDRLARQKGVKFEEEELSPQKPAPATDVAFLRGQELAEYVAQVTTATKWEDGHATNLQFRGSGLKSWQDCTLPIWDWRKGRYRIKPVPHVRYYNIYDNDDVSTPYTSLEMCRVCANSNVRCRLRVTTLDDEVTTELINLKDE